MSGKAVVDTGEMVGKIAAAVDARTDPELVLIARTDAVAVHGLDEALRRAHAYRDAGADMLFVEAPPDTAAAGAGRRRAGRRAADLQLGRGRTHPAAVAAEIAQLGFAVVLFPISTLLAATEGVRELLARVRGEGTPAGPAASLPSFDQMTEPAGPAGAARSASSATPTARPSA